MNAFHSLWCAPFKAINKEFYVSPLDILTTVLSALYWRKKNGKISLICDTPYYEFYKHYNLLNLWDNGIFVLLDNIPKEINPTVFWAAGKIFSLKTQKTPCVMLDTDFIVWEKIDFQDFELGAIHCENLIPQIYPPKQELICAKDFCFDGFDWSVKATNTAFCFFNNKIFKNIYTKTAIDFMLSCKDADNSLTYMVFAEQRLLSMLAKKHNIEIHYFSDIENLFTSNQKSFTHIWGFKKQAQQNPFLMTAFCKKCLLRIKAEFPEYYNLLFKIPHLSIYF